MTHGSSPERTLVPSGPNQANPATGQHSRDPIRSPHSEPTNDQRGAVERVNSRLAGGFRSERPSIRGLAKMRLRVTMALTIMLAMAVGRIRAGQPENLRSLVRPA